MKKKTKKLVKEIPELKGKQAERFLRKMIKVESQQKSKGHSKNLASVLSTHSADKIKNNLIRFAIIFMMPDVILLSDKKFMRFIKKKGENKND